VTAVDAATGAREEHTEALKLLRGIFDEVDGAALARASRSSAALFGWCAVVVKGAVSLREIGGVAKKLDKLAKEGAALKAAGEAAASAVAAMEGRRAQAAEDERRFQAAKAAKLAADEAKEAEQRRRAEQAAPLGSAAAARAAMAGSDGKSAEVEASDDDSDLDTVGGDEEEEEEEEEDEEEDDEEEDSDGDPEDDEDKVPERGASFGFGLEEENAELIPWLPPTRALDYATTSPWGTEAVILSVRIVSCSHLPKPHAPAAAAGGGVLPRRASSFDAVTAGALAAGAGAGSVSDWFGGIDPAAREKAEKEKKRAAEAAAGGQDAASVEVELYGAPCDARSWPASKEVGNDGVKHIFDEAFTCAVAEPRLALLRLSVVRAGVPVAQTVVPVHLLRQGVRWCQLYDPVSHSHEVTADYILTRLVVVVSVEPALGKADATKSRFTRLFKKNPKA